MPLSEVFSLLENNAGDQFQYTEIQERFFSKNPDCLTFFDYLIRGYTVLKIRKKFSMKTLEIEKILSKLDKLELIDWIPGGPLAKKYRNAILESFIKGYDKKDTSFYLHDYLEEDLVKIRVKINELFDYLSRANKRAKMSPEKTKSYGVYFSSKEFKWNMDHFLKK